MRDGVLRIGVNGIAVPLDRRFKIAFFEQEVSEVRQRRRVRRFDSQRLFEIGSCELAPFQADARNASLIDQKSTVGRRQAVPCEQRREFGVGVPELAAV